MYRCFNALVVFIGNWSTSKRKAFQAPLALNHVIFVSLRVMSWVLIAGFLSATPAYAQDAPTDDDVNDIAKQLFCPTCENVPLDQCGTSACVQWRDTIRDLLAEGQTESDIKAYFVAQHGERVLNTPTFSGQGLLLWILPMVIAVLAIGGYLSFVRRTTAVQMPVETANVTAATPADYISQLEAELERRRQND